jgi:hypothetical protein
MQAERSLTLLETTIELVEAAQDAADGNDAALAVLDQYLQGSKNKVDGYASVLSSFKYKLQELADAKRRLEDRQRDLLKQQGKMVRQALLSMQIRGVRKLEGNTSDLVLRNNTQSVNVTNLEEVPAKFKDITVKPRKQDIKRAIKAGENVPGVELTSDVRLEIR